MNVLHPLHSHATTSSLPVIGRAERADFPSLGQRKVPVKIDTGADSCSIWASCVERKGGLEIVFFGEGSKFYTGTVYEFKKGQFELTRVANSFGTHEVRYKIKLPIRINGRLINSSFTLADRAGKLYPVLIGRSLLMNKFVVDVSAGRPLASAERRRARALKQELATLKKERQI